MNPERDDPILDACLDEVLGGRKAPDLTDRILRALGEKANPPLTRSNGTAVPLQPAKLGRKADRMWYWVAVAAGVGGLGITLGIAALKFAPVPADNRSQVAAKDESPRSPSDASLPRPQVAGNDRSHTPAPDSRLAQNHGLPSVVIPLDVPIKGSVDASPPVTEPRTQVAHQPVPDEELLSLVNAELRRSWSDAGVNPASPAEDNEWCRRVFVRLLGRIPTHEELTAFIDQKSPQKREQLVDRLLGEEYAEQFASHWAGVWTNVLIGRTGGAEGSPASREGLETYLKQSLLAGKPYDQIVAELLTASGTSRPGSPNFNGAVNFLLAGIGDNATLATTRVSRVFLGQQLHCAQCHSHPSEDWSQHQYWALNSFLRQLEARPEGDFVRLAAADFVNKPGVTKDGEVYYQQSNGELKAADPVFIDGTKIDPSGKLAEVDRRRELAEMVVQSEYLPRALVNRLWSHFFGYGFTQPIDDMGPHNEVSHPEVLDALAQQFVAHDYDLRRAMRWMVLSDPFQRSSQPAGGGLADQPDHGKAPLFSRYYTRPLKGEEVYQSLIAAADLRKKNPTGATDLELARKDFLEKLYRKLGTDDGEEENLEGGNLHVELMINSSISRRAVSRQQEGRLRSLIDNNELPLEAKIEHLFLAALSRKPTQQEQEALKQILATAKDDQAAALEDIWWALLNSNEFVLDH